MEDFAVPSREHAQTPEGAPGQRQSWPSGGGAEPGAGAGLRAGLRGREVGPKVSTPRIRRRTGAGGGTGEKHEGWGRNLKGWNKGPQKGAGDKGEGTR